MKPFFFIVLVLFVLISVANAALNISTAVYQNDSKDLSAQSAAPRGLWFSSDGTRMFMCDPTNGGNVFEYSLSPAWNLSNATTTAAQKYTDSGISQCSFSSDGTKMVTMLNDGSAVKWYNLSTAWMINTTTTKTTFTLSDYGQPVYSNDGTRLYVVKNTGTTAATVRMYFLSQAWNVSTAANLTELTIGGQDTNPWSVWFTPDGTQMFMAGSTNDKIYQYNLASAWNISTAVYSNESKAVATQDNFPFGVFIDSTQTRMFMLGITNKYAYRYSLASTNTAPNVTSITILPANATQYSTLNCSATATDAESPALNVTFAYQRNGAFYANTTRSCANNTACLANLTIAPPLTIGDSWSCSAFANDGTVSSAVLFSANTTVTMPPITLSFSNLTTPTGAVNDTWIYADVSGTTAIKNVTIMLESFNGTAWTATSVFINSAPFAYNFTIPNSGTYRLSATGYSTAGAFGATPYNYYYYNVVLSLLVVAITLAVSFFMLAFAEFSDNKMIGVFAGVLLLVLGLACFIIPVSSQTGEINSVQKNVLNVTDNVTMAFNTTLSGTVTPIYSPVTFSLAGWDMTLGFIFLLAGLFCVFKYSLFA